MALALERHPAFRTRALAVAEAESRARLEAREAWPEPVVGLAYGREGESEAGVDVWLATLSLPIPLWDANRGDRARAGAELEVAWAEEAALHRQWTARLGRAALAVDMAAERVAIFGADVLPVVEQNLALIQRAYELGELDIHAVSQTRERLLDSQIRALDARADYVRALAELEALLGTEVERVLEAPADPAPDGEGVP
jgi:cobalt-zinc-cadmium efflux system outer membrane protein